MGQGEPALAERSGKAPPVADCRIAVISTAILDRTCIAAGLQPGNAQPIRTYADVADIPLHPAPDLLLFQASDARSMAEWLPPQLANAVERWSGCAFLVLADTDDPGPQLRAIEAGARGITSSTADTVQIEAAITLLAAGALVMPATLARHLLSDRAERSGKPSQPAQEMFRMLDITRRQREVLQLLAEGMSNRRIAERLEISESTVKVHVRAIMTQSGVSNRTQVVAHFLGRPDPR